MWLQAIRPHPLEGLSKILGYLNELRSNHGLVSQVQWNTHLHNPTLVPCLQSISNPNHCSAFVLYDDSNSLFYMVKTNSWFLFFSSLSVSSFCAINQHHWSVRRRFLSTIASLLTFLTDERGKKQRKYFLWSIISEKTSIKHTHAFLGKTTLGLQRPLRTQSYTHTHAHTTYSSYKKNNNTPLLWVDST